MSETENNSMRKIIISENTLKSKGIDVVTSEEIEIIIIPENIDMSEINNERRF